MPLLSVVLPTHNRASRLRTAVDSVLGQTWRDLELIVVDDGSTDETSRVLADVAEKDQRVRAARSSASEGAPAARNRGIALSSGVFLAFLDDDDRWLPEKAETQLSFLKDHGDVGVVSCQYFLIDERHPDRSPVLFRGPTNYSPSAMLWANFPGSCSFGMVRRESFSTDLRFDERLRACQDWDLWVRCSDEARVVTLPSALCAYSWRGSNQLSSPDRIPDAIEVFLRKHDARMTDACRSFHKARLQLVRATGLGERLRLHAGFLRTLPGEVRRPVLLLALAARAGELVRDPGFAWRILAHQAERAR